MAAMRRRGQSLSQKTEFESKDKAKPRPPHASWPFAEAEKLHQALRARKQTHAVLQTGYGASGLPHIGTFTEVARTDMVRRALTALAPNLPSKLICFCDDMDGLRKVPDNVPQPEMLAQHLHKPLSAIPDPFGTHESFGAHNGARLRQFLDRFGFSYEFLSATDCYRSGRFDGWLRKVLEQYDEICALILPTLGPARRASYSPFLPICPRSGAVLLARVVERDAARGRIVYEHPQTGARAESLVTGGACKLQWKVDWAMRWAALGVDYEMAGKDLSESHRLASQICRCLGAPPPQGFIYELFLDEKGEKISKSRGNGLSLEDWLRYAPRESLAYYLYRNPRKARRLYFDVVPKAVDDYQQGLEDFAQQDERARRANPVWHVHGGDVPRPGTVIGFSLLLHLAAASGAARRDILWGFIRRQYPEANAQAEPWLDRLVGHAITYCEDFVAPQKHLRAPSQPERAALEALAARLDALPPDADADAIQKEVYALGRAHYGTRLRQWFAMLYQVLLGQEGGPRFGSFIALYGIADMAAHIRRRLDGDTGGGTDSDTDGGR